MRCSSGVRSPERVNYPTTTGAACDPFNDPGGCAAGRSAIGASPAQASVHHRTSVDGLLRSRTALAYFMQPASAAGQGSRPKGPWPLR